MPSADSFLDEKPLSADSFLDEPDYEAQGLPAGISEREARRLNLLSEMAAAQSETERTQRSAQNIGEWMRVVEPFTPSGMLNVPGRLAGQHDIFEAGKPIVTLPGSLKPYKSDESISAGLGRLAGGVVEGLTTPEMVVTIPAAGPSKAVRAFFGTDIARHIPEQVAQAATVAGDVQSSPADIVESSGQPVVSAAMAGMIAKHSQPKPANISEYPGLPDPDLVARNVASPGTVRPTEIQRFGPETPSAPPMFEAGEVPFKDMRRFGNLPIPDPEIVGKTGLLPKPEFIEETRPKMELETRGKVSFGAEAPTLVRTAIDQGEQIGLTKSVEALKETAGEKEAPPYRAPKEFTAEEAARQERKAAKQSVEEGMYLEQPPFQEILPEEAQFPPPVGMPQGTLSKLQSSRIQAGKENVRSNVSNNPPQPPPTEGGIISGSAAEKWADDILGKDPRSKTRMALDPLEEGKRIAAIAIKGAAIIERGVTDFAGWSVEMVNKFGPEIKADLSKIYAQSKAYITSEKERTKAVPSTEGENAQMRKSAARATESPMVPEPVQETIKTADESFYKQQSTAKVEDAVKSMSDAELGAVPSDSNLYVASRLEQADRLFKAGNNEAGYNVFVELEKQGTSFGQNINQFKRLAGTMPEYIPRIIDQKLTKAGKDPLKPKQAEVITELARDSKVRDKALDDATYEWQKNPTPENAKKAELALDTAEKSALKLQSQVNRFTPRTTANVLKSVLQGNLLTPISEVANVFGNMSFSPFRAMDRTIAAGIDAIDSFIRNKPREITVQPIRGTLETSKGAARGLAKVPEILAKGTGDTIKGESRAGLHPIRAWVDQFAKNPDRPTVGGKLGLAERLNMAIEGTFGVPAEAMLRGLGAGDMPFREAAKARITSAYLKLAKVPKEQWAFAQKFPELFLDPITREKIRTETMEAIFQRDSKTLNIFTHWLRGKGDWFDLAVATVAPYKLTPWNIIAEILSYNPLVATAKTVRDAATGNGKGAKLNAGKFAVGSMLTATGYWLYSKGLLAPSLDERDEAQKARMLAGDTLPPNHLNISGLKRALEGGDPALKPGDETVDVMRAGGLAGSVLYMTANIGREFEKKPAVEDSDLWLAILRQSTLEQARFGLNQSFLSGVEGMLTAIKDGNTDNYVRQWANTVSSIPLPNTLATVSRATREYKPDLKSDTFAKQMENIARNKLGFTGLDDYLPLKRDLWGKPMLETPKDRNALLYQFFDISKNRQVTDDAVPLELYRLWRKTGDTKVIPSIPEKTLTVGKQNYVLTPEQQSRFVELVGEARRNIVDAVVINPNFHNLPDEAKVNLLDRIYREGLQAGKVKLWQEMQGQLAPKPNRAGFNPE